MMLNTFNGNKGLTEWSFTFEEFYLLEISF